MSATSDFLEKVFKIQRITEWRFDHPEQYQQFCDWAGDGTDVSNSKLNTDQRKWLKYLQRTGPNDTDPFEREGGDKKGFIKIQDYPPATDLDAKDPEAWKNLYTICRNAWYQMKHDPAYAGYKDSVKQFIANNARFFDDVAEDVLEANGALTVNAINSLFEILDGQNLSVLGVEAYEFQKLKEKNYNIVAPSVPKYNTDVDVRKRIQEIADKLINLEYKQEGELSRAERNLRDKLDTKANALGITRTPYLLNFIDDKGIRRITDEYTGWRKTANNDKLDDFKANYVSFVRTIYSNDDVYQAFEAKEGGDKPITSAITKAKTDVDYDKTDSANYVPPKHEEQLTLYEQIKKWTGDTFSDYFKKYEGLRGAKILEHYSEVSDIVKQMDKAEIKPTDDMNKIAEKADGIKKALQGKNPYAAVAFGWFADALNDFKNDSRMSQIMKGALKNGRQMKMLVAELIERAAEDGKKETIDKAKIALELLSVIKYGNTTSKVMDAITEDKDLFKIFSNEKLSWNKNEGMKFVTAAMDKSIRAACLGIGRGAAFLVNRFRRRGTKFNGKLPSKKLSQAYKDWQTKNAADKAAAQAERDSDITTVAADQSEFKKAQDKATADKTNAMSYLRGARAFAPGTEDNEVLAQTEEDINTLKANLGTHQSTVEIFERIIGIVAEAKSKYARLQELEAEEATVTGSAMTTEQKTARLEEIIHERNQIQKEFEELGYKGVLDLSVLGRAPIDLKTVPVATATNTAGTGILDVLEDDLTNATAYTNAQTYVSNSHTAIYQRQQHIDTYRKATEDLKAAEAQIEARRKKIDEWDGNHQDVRQLLTAYWDTLQDPSLTRFGPWRASKIQERNSDLVPQLYQKKLSGYMLR